VEGHCGGVVGPGGRVVDHHGETTICCDGPIPLVVSEL
jgi:hypothetical protein